MILYLQDWAVYPKAIVHANTTNQTFKRMHYVLKDMGIKNNAFFMSLLDPELANVDPFDYENITPELAMKIAIEAKLNPWYYLRELVKVPGVGAKHIDFRLNRANLCLYWCFYNSISLVQIQPRQTGKTFSSETLINHLMHFLYTNTRIKLFTHSSDLMKENIEKFKMIRDGMPTYLIHHTVKDTENKEEVAYAALHNTYTTKTAQQGVNGAYNVGRGGTVLVNQIDEGPFCVNLRISYPVLMNAKNAAVSQAKEIKIPYADIFTTTAGRLDTDSGKYTYSIIQKCLPFTEKLYDVPSNTELKYIVEHNSKNNMIYSEFSYRQLGFTKEWADQVAKENNLLEDPGAFARDIENRWTTGNERPGVDPTLLASIDASRMDPVEITEVDGYLFNWYESEEEVWSNNKRFFAIGLDASENINEDFTTVHMLDIADLSTVMTSRCNDEDLIKLAMEIAKLLINHSNVILVPERRSTASMIISIISRELWKVDINPYTRIFNNIYNNRNDPRFAKMDVSGPYASEGPLKKYLGYTTAASGENSRDNLYKLTLNRALKINANTVRDKTLIYELKALTTNDRGKIDHVAGGHDDSVIAFLLASWFVIYGRYHYLYGIPDHLKLSRVSSDGNTVDVSKAQRHKSLGIRIADLKKQINSTTDAIVRQSLIGEMSYLSKQMESLGPLTETKKTIGAYEESMGNGTSISDIIQDIQQYDSRNSYQRRFEQRVKDPFGTTLQSYWR